MSRTVRAPPNPLYKPELFSCNLSCTLETTRVQVPFKGEMLAFWGTGSGCKPHQSRCPRAPRSRVSAPERGTFPSPTSGVMSLPQRQEDRGESPAAGRCQHLGLNPQGEGEMEWQPGLLSAPALQGTFSVVGKGWHSARRQRLGGRVGVPEAPPAWPERIGHCQWGKGVRPGGGEEGAWCEDRLEPI